jgi:hypothetical protein
MTRDLKSSFAALEDPSLVRQKKLTNPSGKGTVTLFKPLHEYGEVVGCSNYCRHPDFLGHGYLHTAPLEELCWSFTRDNRC